MNREICQKLEQYLVIVYERSVNFSQLFTSSRFECNRDVNTRGFVFCGLGWQLQNMI
jgi:hypothetical protein